MTNRRPRLNVLPREFERSPDEPDKPVPDECEDDDPQTIAERTISDMMIHAFPEIHNVVQRTVTESQLIIIRTIKDGYAICQGDAGAFEKFLSELEQSVMIDSQPQAEPGSTEK